MPFDDLKEEQITFSKNIILKDEFSQIRTIAGIDHVMHEKQIILMIALCDADTLGVLDHKFCVAQEEMNYVPGLLAFRLMPLIEKAYSLLKSKPDIIITNGHGILHPRGCGLASHVGLRFDVPTIGIAKKLLVGSLEDGEVLLKGKVAGYALETKGQPIFVSPGHKISARSAFAIVQNAMLDHKLPEPVFIAHEFASKQRDKLRKTFKSPSV